MKWHDAKTSKPPHDTEVLCKVKGMEFTKHRVAKWDAYCESWIMWGYWGNDICGWAGLKKGWKITEWTLIEDRIWQENERNPKAHSLREPRTR